MNRFIEKLVREKKIKLVSKSEDVAKSYMFKSNKSLVSSKALIEIGNYDDATALVYYSMYYSALALLFRSGIKCENHSGTIILLKELFNIDNKEIKNAKKERVDKQYYVDFEATKEDVKMGIEIAERFTALVKDKIDRIQNFEIDETLKKFKNNYSL